jgi:molybdate transport system ATP-binding protein
MKIINARSKHLIVEKFMAAPQEAWCLLGNNRSGIEDFFTLMDGNSRDIHADLIELPEHLGIISFSRQQKVFEEELKKNDTDFLDKIDPGTPAASFLKNPEIHADLIKSFGMTDSMNKGYRQLSTGQSRKLMLLAQITRGVSYIAIQAPYEGLDPASCRELDRALTLLHQQGIGILITVNSKGDIPNFCTHVGRIAHGRLDLMGPRNHTLAALEKEQNTENPDFQVSVKELIEDQNMAQTLREIPGTLSPSETKAPAELVYLKNGSAGYEGKPIFTDLNLKIHTGDHTLVTGPNGCGKSTLLQLITGDHPACYQNDLRIFGIQRGTGESIWELKKKMGIVSPDLHRNYFVPGTALHCILSGLFDSIGLYQKYTRQDEHQAQKWLERTGLIRETHTPFRQLGYASQRLVLIARALIKLPRLLILDEPTQGLDELNRKAVLDFLEQVAREKLSTLLYVSHRQDEFRDFFKYRIQL